MKSYFLGFDIGSHASKGVIVDTDGSVLISRSMRHDTSTPCQGCQEQDPGIWWNEFREITKYLIKESGMDPEKLKSVGITGFVPGLVLMDGGSSIIRPAIMHTDIRAVSQLRYINKMLDPSINHGFLLPKLLWVRDNEKPLYEKIKKVLVPHSYIVQQLTGKASCDVDTATVFGGIYDEKSGCWSERISSSLGLDSLILPELYNADSIVGGITPEASKDTGLVEGTPVIAGTGDSFASILGCGAVLKGDMMIYLGTSGTQIFMAGRLSEIVERQHFGPGKAEFAGKIISCGDSMEHFRKILGFKNWMVPDSKAFQIPPGSQGLFVFPHLKQKSGKDSTRRNLETIFGLETNHTEWHIYRALLEGIAYNLKTSFIRYEPKVKRLILSGGGAKSRVFRQIIRDILGKEVYYSTSGSGAAGIALLAAQGTGVIELEKVSTLEASEAERSEPDADIVGKYAGYYKVYRSLKENIERLYIVQGEKFESL